MSLEELRKNLSAVDRRLVEMIAERQRIVGEIGKSKQTTGTGTRDYAREKNVLDMGRAQAVELGVDPDLVEQLLEKLIRTSLESQERDRVVAEGKGDGRRVLVIGGAGKMGRWFVDFFVSQGFATTVADPRRYCGGRTFGRVRSYSCATRRVKTQGPDFRYWVFKVAVDRWTQRAAGCGLSRDVIASNVWPGYTLVIRSASDLLRCR
jgi:chorismate mutase